MSSDLKAYWRSNLRYLAILLGIWAFVSFGLSIFLAEPLNAIRLGGYKLGFWFAQQGSIFVYLVLIWLYVRWMNKLDHKHDVDEDKIDSEPIHG